MVLGIVLLVVGVLFIFLGIVAAARQAVRSSAERQPEGIAPFDPEKWGKLIDAVTNLIKAAPLWLLLTAVGAGLVAWGGAML